MRKTLRHAASSGRLLRHFITCLVLMVFSAGVQLTAQDAHLEFVCMDGQLGDTVCVQVLADGFTDIESIELTITWDPAVIDFIDIQNAALSGSTWYNQIGPNTLKIVWVGFPDVLTLPNGGLVFEVCFQVVTLTPSFSDVGLDVTDAIEISGPGGELNVTFTPCNVNVTPPMDVAALFSSCGPMAGDNDGTFTITIAGGTGPYTYTWVNTGDPTINGASMILNSGDSESQNVPPGMYDIVVTDALGNMVMYTITVDALFPTFGADGFDPTCFDFTNGRLVLEAADGTPPYGALWDNVSNANYAGSAFIQSSGSSVNINSLPVGEYHVTITDDRGCAFIDTVNLAAPPFTIDAVINNATCTGAMDGSVSLTFGGANPYPGGLYDISPSWTGGTFQLSQLNTAPIFDPGTYSVTISDMVNNCDTVYSFTIGADTEVTGSFQFSSTSCVGVADGEVVVTGLTNGSTVGPYSFQLLNSGGFPLGQPVSGVTTVTYDGLASNMYSVVITEGPCTSDTLPFMIMGPEPLNIQLVEVIPNGCTAGAMTGEITVLASGGTLGPGSDYEYAWNGGTLMGSTISNLGSGNYFLTVTDDNMCTATLTVNVSQATGPVIQEIVASDQSCSSDTITLEVVFTEGSNPVTDIQWSTGDTTAIITTTASGNVTVTIRDSLFCFDIESFMIPDVQRLVIDSVTLVPPSCAGVSDGEVSVFVSEGTGAYTYLWSTGDTTTSNSLTGLVDGDYSVTVVDADTCIIAADTMFSLVSTVSMMVIDSVILEPPTCSGDMDGQFTVHVSQGTEPYTYIWSTGDTTSNNLLAGLGEGVYGVTVVEANACASPVDTTITLMSDPPLGFVFSSIQGTSCETTCDGVATLMPTGGVGGLPYDILWESGERDTAMMSTASNLCGGFQTVTISQDNLCFFTDSVLIPSPAPIDVDTVGFSQVSCFGGNDGFVSLTASGGNGGFTFTWNTLPPGQIQNNLGAGTYSYTITDANNCSYSDSITISEPDTLVARIDTAGTVPVSCVGQNSGQISVTQSGGRPGYSYTWSPAVSTSDVATGLDVGTYYITVTDGAGCTDSVSYTLTGSPPVVGYVPNVPAPECFGQTSLITVDSASGGVGGFTFAINGGQRYPLDTAIAVSPGAYFVIVYDSLGCSDTTSLIIDNPDPLIAEVIPEDPVVDLGDSLLLELLLNGSQGGIDSVSWSFSGPLSCYDCPNPYALNTQPSFYTVFVTDTAGCTTEIDVFVDVNSNRQVYIPNVFSPNFDGRNDDFVIQLGQGVLGVPAMRIFNRWGELMMERRDVGINGGGVFVWDGMFNGKEMPPGVYVYMIEVAFADGETLIYRGDVTLLR